MAHCESRRISAPLAARLAPHGNGCLECARRTCTADLESGDGFVRAVLGPARSVRARVTIDDRAGLPGELSLTTESGAITGLVEDPERGLVDFTFWPRDANARAELRCYASWRHSIGVAMLEPGTGPAEVTFALQRHASATIDLVPPPDGVFQLLVERWFGDGPDQRAIWTHVQHTGSALPRLTNLRPGRYQLRDGTSNTTGPTLTVTSDSPDAPDAVLRLDLSRVVPITGTVVTDQLRDVTVAVRDATGRILTSTPVHSDGTFTLRVSLDRDDLHLTATRNRTSTTPLPIRTALENITLRL